ncbi:MAG TPA: hypothetical protein PLJ04_03510, partial [Candidatus Saccharibacteria bacterium]|nr:hypothetical protein [Candidatus Saccharibacteria bacterium]
TVAGQDISTPHVPKTLAGVGKGVGVSVGKGVLVGNGVKVGKGVFVAATTVSGVAVTTSTTGLRLPRLVKKSSVIPKPKTMSASTATPNIIIKFKTASP